MSETPFLRVISYNLFKGRKWWSGQSVLPEMGRALAVYRPDIVLFQEIRGDHPSDAAIAIETAAFMHALGLDQTAFGMNYHGKSSKHGNAIFARQSILRFENFDLSVSRLERRGMLSAECALERGSIPSIRLFCTHLDLRQSGRMQQLANLSREIERHLHPRDEPFILAGDFNDWNLEADIYLKERLGVLEAHEVRFGTLAKTFPSLLPVVKLDRVYFRGLKVREARVLRGPFQFLSDHRPLLVDFDL